MHLNFLTNPDKNLQEKMRYFADYFLFTNEFLGKLPDLPFDNPTSYVSKIIFQLQNNIEWSPPYIENHFTQLLHFFGDYLQKHSQAYPDVKTYYDEYNQCESKVGIRKAWLKSRPDFVTKLLILEQELEETLFSKTYLGLIKFITCKHKLASHKKGIEFYTQILVSLFRLNNHSQESVKKYIDRILSGSHYEFPFPLEMYADSQNESYIEKTKAFLSNRDFKKQFEGLQNLMINAKHRKGNFVYVINHVNITDEIAKTFKVKLDRVTFISPDHRQFSELKKGMKRRDRETSRKDKMYPRFFGKHKLLAYIELNFENKKTTSFTGAQLVAEEINMLNGYLDTTFQMQPSDFLFTVDFKESGWFANMSWLTNKFEWLDPFKLDTLNNTPFARLTGQESNNQLLHNERIFLKADTTGPVSLFWQYIENLFWFQNVGPEKKREKFCVILSKQTKYFTDWLLLHIGYLFYGMGNLKYSEELGMDQTTLKLISSELAHKRNVKFPIGKYLPKIKHPFLRNVIKHYQATKSKKYCNKWDAYFKAVILELYEIRNAELHSGYVNAFAVIKMKSLAPYVIYKARWAIINYWEDHKEMTLEEVIAHVTKPH